MPTDQTDPKTIQQSIEQAKIARGAKLSALERLRGGADLYDEGMRWLTFSIRADNPDFTPAEIDAEIERRKQIVRRIDDKGFFQPAGMAEQDG